MFKSDLNTTEICAFYFLGVLCILMKEEHGQNISAPGEGLPGNGYFHVILPGLQGGGRNLTGLREYIDDRGWVVASLSTRAGLKRHVFNLKTHYQNLAQELITQAQGRVIRIYAHSLGGIEVLDLMKMLACR